MNKSIFNTWILCVVVIGVLPRSLYGQQTVFDADIRLKGGREAFTVVNAASGNTYLFLVDKKSVSALLIDKEFALLDSLAGERPVNATFPDIIGSNQSGDVVNLLFASEYYHHIAIMSFDFGNKKVLQQLVDLPLKGERYAGSTTHQGKFYMFTAIKSSSKIRLYTFNDGAEYSVDDFDFGDEQFDLYSKHLSGVLRKNDLSFVDASLPVSVDEASQKNKLYCDGNSFILTFDNLPTSTEVITINLESKRAQFTRYPHALECKNAQSSNSFVQDGHLYQFKCCNDQMELVITPLGTQEPVQTFRATRDGNIKFNNTDIAWKGGVYSFSGERDPSEAKKFLRKVANSNAGVSVYNTPLGKVVTLGGYKEVTSGGGAMPMGYATTISTPMGVIAGANPVGHSFGGYTWSSAIQFKTLLNPRTLEHVEGKITENVFDRIHDFEEEIELDAKSLMGRTLAATMFKYGDGCVYGYYHRKNRRYVLVAFPNEQPQ